MINHKRRGEYVKTSLPMNHPIRAEQEVLKGTLNPTERPDYKLVVLPPVGSEDHAPLRPPHKNTG